MLISPRIPWQERILLATLAALCLFNAAKGDGWLAVAAGLLVLALALR